MNQHFTINQVRDLVQLILMEGVPSFVILVTYIITSFRTHSLPILRGYNDLCTQEKNHQ